MACPHCAATTTTEVPKCTQLGYRIFRCSACRRQFNERTGSSFNSLELATDIVHLVVLRRVRYKLSLRDLAEMFLERASRRSWPTSCGPSARVRLAAPGMSMKPTFVSAAPGSSCSGRLIARATWSNRC